MLAGNFAEGRADEFLHHAVASHAGVLLQQGRRCRTARFPVNRRLDRLACTAIGLDAALGTDQPVLLSQIAVVVAGSEGGYTREYGVQSK